MISKYKTIIAIYGQDAFKKHYESTKGRGRFIIDLQDKSNRSTWDRAKLKELIDTNIISILPASERLVLTGSDWLHHWGYFSEKEDGVYELEINNGSNSSLATERNKTPIFDKKTRTLLFARGLEPDFFEKNTNNVLSRLGEALDIANGQLGKHTFKL